MSACCFSLRPAFGQTSQAGRSDFKRRIASDWWNMPLGDFRLAFISALRGDSFSDTWDINYRGSLAVGSVKTPPNALLSPRQTGPSTILQSSILQVSPVTAYGMRWDQGAINNAGRDTITNDNWNGGTGNWSVGSNWSLGTEPGSNNNAVIMAASSVVTDSVVDTVNGLTVGKGDSLMLSNATLTATANATNKGTIESVGGYSNTLGGGTFTNAASGVVQVDNDSTLTLQSGTYSNAGSITLNSGGNYTQLVGT
jgi:hypothetical protein